MDSGSKTNVPNAIPNKAAIDRAFERKVRRARWVLFFEKLWLRVWLLISVAGLFVLATLVGVWPSLGDAGHVVVLSLFALAALAAATYLVRTPWPSREAAVHRIESVSGVPHRPATSYEDTLTTSADQTETRTIWIAHRRRMAALLSRLRTGKPRPRTDRFDPFALRALGTLGVVLLIALAGPGLVDRLGSAFRFSSADRFAEARLDAWVTPPPYTGRPPLMLADGANPIGGARADEAVASPVAQEVPERSVVIARASGLGSSALTIEVPGADPDKPEVIEAEAGSGQQGVQEARYEIRNGTTLRVKAGGTVIAEWPLTVLPDQTPSIALIDKLSRTPRGSLKLKYKVEDDYGVASAEVKLKKAPPKPADPKRAWAAAKPLTGPRPPLMRPPPLPLRLPQANAKTGEATSFLELASHPWAGLRVLMTLEAKDVAGQTGRSETIELVLPERQFKKPLARAVIEQRRKLLDDPRYRDQVRTALNALTFAPEGFIEDMRVYLGLRSVYYRLQNDRSRAGMKSVIEQLWHIALRIEDGNLSDAERRLREAQDRLAKALEEGASEEEIARLMKELRDAFNEFAREMAKNRGDEDSLPDGQAGEELTQQDLDEMMSALEDMAKNGSREEALRMLAEMQELMERMQSGQQNRQRAQENKQIMKMMEELSSMLGEQQQLMDDTFSEQRKAGQRAGQRNDGRGRQRGQRSGRPGSQQGQRGLGQRGDEGSRGQFGEGDQMGQQGRGRGQLGERQRSLRERLSELKERMRRKRAGDQDSLEAAREAMGAAERALEESEFGSATDAQAEALDEMRRSAQQMAEQMLANSPGRYGQNRNNRDPLGRPQRTRGPDLGTSVKVPSEIDRQRAREILEELRRRLGEATRPPPELDYLERLERRF